jgi:hypothetical protein
MTLMAGAGTPGGQPEARPTAPIRLVARTTACSWSTARGTSFIWQYGQFGPGGNGPDQLNTPVQNTWLPRDDERDCDDEHFAEVAKIPHGHVLITDQANERIIEINLSKQIVWQYGTSGVSGNGPEQLNNPNCAELLELRGVKL